MDNLLACWDKEKEINTVRIATYNKKNSPFALPVDGIAGKEDLVVLINLSRLIAIKIKELLSHVDGWVNVRITIAAPRSYWRMICKYFLPSPLWN